MAGTELPDNDLEKGPSTDSAASGESHTSTNTLDTETSRSSVSDDWTTSLDESHDVQVLEFRSGSNQWETVQVTEIEDTSTLPESVLIRLYLIEGLAQKTISFFSGFNKDFFCYHRLNVLPYDRAGFGNDYFFGKWSRRAYQNHEQWDIEKRISKGRPYNLDLITDPKDVGLNHKRYERATSAYRPYSSLEADSNTDKRLMRQAVEDCISSCYKRVDGRLIGKPPLQTFRPCGFSRLTPMFTIVLLVFDAPRKVRVIQKDYKRSKNKKNPDQRIDQDCFSDFKPSRQRFREQLDISANFAAFTHTPEHSIRDMILRFLLDDHMEIMSDFREALDFTDEHMSDDEALRTCLQDWRRLLGQWKRNLSNDLRSIAYVTQSLFHKPGKDIMDQDLINLTRSRLGRINSAFTPPEQGDFDELTKEVKGLMERANSTFQAIMATMGIVESQKAIAQAETISKLTNLAFFFIPLTLCASIFGMNIKVSNAYTFIPRLASTSLG